MFSASAMALGRINLPLRVHKTAQKISVFIINLIYFLIAEMTNLYIHTNDTNWKRINTNHE